MLNKSILIFTLFLIILVFCCEALIAECEACKLGITVDAFCKDQPDYDGCTPVVGSKFLVLIFKTEALFFIIVL